MNGRRSTIVLGGLLTLASACDDASAPDTAGGPVADAGAADAAAVEAAADGAAAEGAAAGGSKAATPGAAEPPEPPPSGHAVAKLGSLLFFSSKGEVGVELPPMGPKAMASPGMTVNVVGEQDGRLVVETLVAQPAEHHCAATLENLSDFRLRLFVGRDDLLPVLTEDFEHEHEDGTKVRLTRGVPVPPGTSTLLVRGTPVRVSVPEERLGRFYEPAVPLSSEGIERRLPAMAGNDLTYGGAILDETQLFQEDGDLAVFGTSPREGGGLVTVRNPCLELTAFVSQDRLDAPAVSAGRELYAMKRSGGSAGILGKMDEESGHFLASPYGGAFAVGGDDEDVWGGLTGTEIGEAYGVGGLGLVGTGGSNPTYEVKAGTAIVWADGNPAGQVIADHTFAEQPRDDGGRTCFDAVIVGANGPTVSLCFAPADVGKHEPTGGFGLIGTGTGLGTGSGYGRGTGAGFGGRGKKVPRVRQAKAAVTGSLDKDIIRRIVRAHINEVRSCYNAGLTKDPALAGKVEVRFTISPAGSVSTSDVASSTLSDKGVSQCIAKAVKRWKFPKPMGGGVVLVTYPFVLEPG